MRVALAMTVMFLASVASAHAINNKDFMTANEVGQIIGAADLCGYKLDDAKTAAFMENTVANLDEGSRMHFSNVRSVQGHVFKGMTETERKAQCALQAKLAQKYGLTP
ncbi:MULTISPECIES: hypothetical protein [Rhizobium]|uniref:hypothetical protein n=1 Tax=Rhizobium TaxID=379 RepID=UPI000382475C|nr:hypothetical protein [Rhizobium leguminosarum]TBZ81422.1 hypothetical protein E0H61_14910 [Rhizobium leguminosarum bv. viciae]